MGAIEKQRIIFFHHYIKIETTLHKRVVFLLKFFTNSIFQNDFIHIQLLNLCYELFGSPQQKIFCKKI